MRGERIDTQAERFKKTVSPEEAQRRHQQALADRERLRQQQGRETAPRRS